MTDVDRDLKRAQFEAEALVHLDDLYGLALRLTAGDEPWAEDLVQTTCLRAYQRWSQYEVGTNCRAWLMTILRSTFINEYHAGRKQPTPVDYDEVGEWSVFEDRSPEDPEARFFERVVDERIVAALDALPDDFRLPLVLSDLQGLKYREIAESLGVPVGTVKSRLFRARRQLQRDLYDYARDAGLVS